MTKKLYEVLELPNTASIDDVKSAYKKLALKYHPDKTKNDEAMAERFKEISNAYQVLSDPQKKQQYDAFGDTGPGASSQGFDPSSLFEKLFGMPGMGMPAFGQPTKNTSTHTVLVSIADLINGKSFNITYPRKLCCVTCDGTGSTTKQTTTCKECKGSKVIMMNRQVGPNMYVQQMAPCASCDAAGVSKPAPEFFCGNCKSTGTITSTSTTASVYMTPGLPDNFPRTPKSVVLAKQGDYDKSTRTYNDLYVLFTIDEESIGDAIKIVIPEGHIQMTVSITLDEAIHGFANKSLQLPDNTNITLGSKKVLTPYEPSILIGRGLFYENNRKQRGDIVLQWNVVFPSSIDTDVDTSACDIVLM